MPSEGFSVGLDNTKLGEGTDVQVKGGDVISGFQEFERAANSEKSRADYGGRRVEVKAQVAPSSDRRQFALQRYKMACCAADAVPINLIVLVQDDDEKGKTFNSGLLQSQWVEVQGILQFRLKQGTQEYISVIKAKAEDIKVVARPPNPFIY